MPLADYAHWNEDAERVWYEEEGRHSDDEYRDDDDVDYRYDEPTPHSSLDECVATGDMSTKDGVLWTCDHCDEGPLGGTVFVLEDNVFEVSEPCRRDTGCGENPCVCQHPTK